MKPIFWNEDMELDPQDELTESEQLLLEQVFDAYEGTTDGEDCEVTEDEVQFVLNKVLQSLEDRRQADAQEIRLRMLKQSQREAMQASRASTLEALTLDLGTLADGFGANRGWIYLVKQEERELVLRAVVTHRTNQRGVKLTIRQETPGVVAAATRTGELTTTTDTIGNSQESEAAPLKTATVAVPIFDAEGELLLGILCLESESHEFTAADQASLKVAAHRLAVPLVCLQWNRPEARHWPWAPAHQRWGTAVVPQQVCGALTKALGYGDCSDDCSVILWLMDRTKDLLHVVGTTYYDAEYVADAQLPSESYTGAIADLPRGAVERSSPQDARFLMQKRALAAGLQEIISAPLYRPDEFGDVEKKAWGVLNAYYFRECPLTGSHFREEFADIAFLLEDWLAHYERIRLQCALSYLRWRLEVKAREWKKWPQLDEESNAACLRGGQFRVLQDVLMEVLGGDGCSLYVPDEERRRLVMVTSTGVGWRTGSDAEFIVREPDNGTPLWYALGDPANERYGIMSFLCEHPETGVLRINSLERFERGEEPGISFSVPRRVIRSHMEPISSEDADRRVLAFSMKQGTSPAIAVRLVRSTTKPPFTEEDVTLLQRLLQLCGDHQFFSVPDSSRDVTLAKVAGQPGSVSPTRSDGL